MCPVTSAIRSRLCSRFRTCRLLKRFTIFPLHPPPQPLCGRLQISCAKQENVLQLHDTFWCYIGRPLFIASADWDTFQRSNAHGVIDKSHCLPFLFGGLRLYVLVMSRQTSFETARDRQETSRPLYLTWIHGVEVVKLRARQGTYVWQRLWLIMQSTEHFVCKTRAVCLYSVKTMGLNIQAVTP